MSNHTSKKKSTVRFVDPQGSDISTGTMVLAVIFILAVGVGLIWVSIETLAIADQTQSAHHIIGATVLWLLTSFWWGKIISVVIEAAQEEREARKQ